MLTKSLIALVLLTAPAAAQDTTEARAKAAVLKKLKDPESARFADIRILETRDGVLVCGTVNAKNDRGGYVGNREFRYLVAGKGAAAIIGQGGEISTDVLDAIAAKYFEGCK